MKYELHPKPKFKVRRIMPKKYRDRHNDERRIVYYIKRHLDKLPRILRKVSK